MKKFVILVSVLFWAWHSSGQTTKEQKSDSKINGVTVFLNNAQITRVKKLNLPQGESRIRFTGLSPFLNPKSIRVSATGAVMILSVKQERNYTADDLKPRGLDDLEKKYKDIKDRITDAKTSLQLIDDEIDLLQRNKVLSGKNQALSVQALQAMENYYSSKMKALRFKRLQQQKVLNRLVEQKIKLRKEIQKIADTKIYPPYEIIVDVSTERPVQSVFTLNYNVSQAHWFPSYDIRVDDISKPLNLTYKANVKQATQVDWNKVLLSFSSANPTVSNEIPHLRPYRLGYQNHNRAVSGPIKTVSGTITDANTGEPLPAANVVVKGTSIGTVSDFDGHYSISLPDKKDNVLIYSYPGYKEVEMPVINPVMNIKMDPGEELQAVVIDISGISVYDDDDDDDYVARPKHKKTKPKAAPKPMEIPLERVEKETSVHFDIKRPYSVPSNNQVKTIPVAHYDIPVQYTYISVPKLDENAYLTARITGWEKYDLLSGEAQVFIDGTSVGKTLLDAGLAKDTLEISLGVDKGIRITRELDKKFSKRIFLGAKRTETRKWRITVKNNKNRPVDIRILDQIPISDSSEMTVEVINLSGGKLNKETGEVEWEIRLKPGKKRELILQYEVKLPKYSGIEVE